MFLVLVRTCGIVSPLSSMGRLSTVTIGSHNVRSLRVDDVVITLPTQFGVGIKTFQVVSGAGSLSLVVVVAHVNTLLSVCKRRGLEYANSSARQALPRYHLS